MANIDPGPETWERISLRRAQLLGCIARGCTLAEAAQSMGTTVAGARSQAERLKDVSRSESIR